MDFAFTEEQDSIRDLIEQVLTDLVTDDSLKALGKPRATVDGARPADELWHPI